MDTERALQRAYDIETSPVTPERVTDINQLALAYFQRAFPGSWAQTYLQRRFDQDLTGHPTIRPGYAPAGWTGLVRHLRHAGVGEEEMLAAGVATTASTGRLIDRFRDRAILPLTHDGRVLAFVGRRHPDLTDHPESDDQPERQHAPKRGQHDRQHGPKYLNTATTVAYSKSAQLYVPDPTLLDRGAIPVLVEGPMDAIAVSLASSGRHVGVAPLGTALSDQQATQLAQHHHRTGVDPAVATDADLAGRLAAQRAYWTLSLHGMDPALAALPPGADPADLYAADGGRRLQHALQGARPLADTLVEERLAHLPPRQAVDAAVAVVAARPSQHWAAAANVLTRRTAQPRPAIDRRLLSAVRAWTTDPRRATETAVGDLRTVRERLQHAAQREQSATRPGPGTSARRWQPVARAIDPRLVHQDDWPALAEVMDQLDGPHLDVAATARALVRTTPLSDDAARDLRYRLLNTAQLLDTARSLAPGRWNGADNPPQVVPRTGAPATVPARRDTVVVSREDRGATGPR
ncbi:toprim domain-containing protein [Jannaschia sp. R86511]